MGERPPMDPREDEIDLLEYFAILSKVWWKVALFSLAVGVVTLLYMYTKPNIYQATAVITPAIDEKMPNPALGTLASFGVSIGGPSKVEDLETLFRSNDLAVRVFMNHDFWPILFGDRFDPRTGTLKVSWRSRLFGKKEPRAPGDWDAIRGAMDRLSVVANLKSGTVTLSFESLSAEGSAQIVKYFLEEGKSRLQEEALDRATKNKKFIEERIGKTVDALTRDRLYALYGQEIEKEMMARNREQFGFRVIDAPRVPDMKYRPKRGRNAFLAFILSFFAGCGFFIVRGTKETKKSPIPKQAETT